MSTLRYIKLSPFCPHPVSSSHQAAAKGLNAGLAKKKKKSKKSTPEGKDKEN